MDDGMHHHLAKRIWTQKNCDEFQMDQWMVKWGESSVMKELQGNQEEGGIGRANGLSEGRFVYEYLFVE